MGSCFSSANKVTGSNSTSSNPPNPNPNPKPARQASSSRTSHRRLPGVPCGKRTDFGYAKDFEASFSVGKLLGRGQFGYTFVATDRVTGDRVAVKRIDKNKMLLPVAVEDVKREVKILQALKGHENVVDFHNAYEDDSFVYIVMEYD